MNEKHFAALSPHGFHRVHYYEWGRADNPRVLMCVHGLTRTGRDFDELAKALSHKYRVICPDVIGRGKSAWLTHKEDYGYPLYCSNMAALIARSAAVSVDWVGTSMGGIIGMLLAAQPSNPIRRLVVNDVGPHIPKSALERLKIYVGKAPKFDSIEDAEAYVRQVSAHFGELTDPQWRHLTETAIRQSEDGKWGLVYDPALAHAFSGPLEDVNLWPFWDQVQCPTLVLRGASSDLLLEQTAREMTQRGPKARLIEFDEIGHAPMLMSEEQI
ncbi:MAG: alpha/beta fold hydrolase, partial [Burkholderiales bacterium]